MIMSALNGVQTGGFKADIAGSGNVCARDGDLLGIFVTATASGTLALYDDAATGTTTKIINTVTFAAIGWYPLPVRFNKGLNAVVGGTLNATLVFA